MPTQAPSRPGRAPQPPAKRNSVNVLVIAVGAVIALFLAGLLGWVLKTASLPMYQARITSTFDARITSMVASQTGGCVTPLNGGARVCSRFVVVPNHQFSRALHLGQIVHVAHAWVNAKPTGWEDLLLIYTTNP